MVTKTNIFAHYAAQAINWWIRIRPRSLRVRLALFSALLLCLIQFLLVIVFYAFTTSWLLGQIDQHLITTATQVASVLSDGEPLQRDDLEFQFDQYRGVAAALLLERHFFVRMIDRNSGEVLNESADYRLPVTTRARSGVSGYETLGSPDLLMRVYTLPLDDSTMALQIGRSLDEVNQTRMQILRLLLLALAAAVLLALVSGWLLADRALISVHAITRTAQDIGEKDLSRRIDMNLPDDELGQLAQTFNRMLDRIEKAFQRQRQFTADAAHELRTPLSIMQTGLDVALLQPRSPAFYRATLESIHEEVGRLSQLTVHLLTLAREDVHTTAFEPRPTNLSLLVHTVAEQIAIAAEQKQITLRCAVPRQIIVQGDEGRLIQLTLNLLENAVKYTPAGGSISVRLAEAGGQVCMSVADTGIGIPAEHLPFIFDRFYRADPARSRQQGGFGLGLAIARQIAQLHGGDIAVVSQPGSGSEFTLTMPVS